MNEIQLSDSLLKKKELKLRRVGQCEICEYDFKPTLQLHHVIPVSKGGCDSLENLMLLCPNCHKTIHAIASDSIGQRYTDEYIDNWLYNNNSKKQVYAYFKLALRATTGLEAEEFEQFIIRSQSERNS